MPKRPKSNAAQKARSLRQRQTESRRVPRSPDRAINGERSTVTAFRLQHTDNKGLSDIGKVVDSNGDICRPAGRINDTLQRMRAKGSLDEVSYCAGLKLQDLAGVANLEPIGSAPLERVSCQSSEGLLTDAMLTARKELSTCMDHIGRGTLQALAVHRCICEGYTIGGFCEVEREADGSKMNAMMATGLIRGGLERLALELYGEKPMNGNAPRPPMQSLTGDDVLPVARDSL